MPRKSKRVASRQAQLSGRSKRVRTHGPAGIPVTPARQDQESREESESVGVTHPSATDSPEALSAPKDTRSARVISSRPKGRIAQTKPVEFYFIPELRRIGLISLAMFAILAVLFFVLP